MKRSLRWSSLKVSVPVSVAFRPITWGRYIDELATTVCTHPHDASWSGGCEVCVRRVGRCSPYVRSLSRLLQTAWQCQLGCGCPLLSCCQRKQGGTCPRVVSGGVGLWRRGVHAASMQGHVDHLYWHTE